MKQIETLLKKTANEHAAELCELGDTVSEKSLKKGSAFSETKVPGGNAYLVIRAAAITSGTVIKDDRESGILAALLKGGVANMAPVLLVAIVQDTEVKLGCYSKEGLIAQHAAKNALRTFVEAISIV